MKKNATKILTSFLLAGLMLVACKEPVPSPTDSISPTPSLSNPPSTDESTSIKDNTSPDENTTPSETPDGNLVPGEGKLYIWVQNGSSGSVIQKIKITGPDWDKEIEFVDTAGGSSVVRLEIDVKEGSYSINRVTGTVDIFEMDLNQLWLFQKLPVSLSHHKERLSS